MCQKHRLFAAQLPRGPGPAPLTLGVAAGEWHFAVHCFMAMLQPSQKGMLLYKYKQQPAKGLQEAKLRDLRRAALSRSLHNIRRVASIPSVMSQSITDVSSSKLYAPLPPWCSTPRLVVTTGPVGSGRGDNACVAACATPSLCTPLRQATAAGMPSTFHVLRLATLRQYRCVGSRAGTWMDAARRWPPVLLHQAACLHCHAAFGHDPQVWATRTRCKCVHSCGRASHRTEAAHDQRSIAICLARPWKVCSCYLPGGSCLACADR